jgi:hypothetical protein
MSVKVKKADEEMMFGSVGVFPGCFNRLKCWLAYQLPVLHVLLLPPPAPNDRGLCWTCTYLVLHLTHNPKHLTVFFLNFCFHFIYFPKFFLCYLCETCIVVDLFLSKASKTTDFKFTILNLSFMQINLASRLSFGMRHLTMFKHFEVICCLYIQKIPWKWKQQVC